MTMPAAKTLVFAATYDERGNIEGLCNAVLALRQNYDLLIVDDNSPDGTGDVLNRLAAAEERLRVVHRPTKMGLGSAHKLAMQYAIRNGYETLITMDADFSHDPGDIPRLEERLAGADFVIGSRYVSGGHCDYTGYRFYVSLLANRAARWLLGMPLHEMTTSFRSFRVARLKRLRFAEIKSQGYGFFLESVYRFHRAGFRCAEIPILFQDRQAGHSKIPRFEIVVGIVNLLRLFVLRFARRKAERREPEPLGPCYSCDSPYVITQFARRGPEAEGPEAFKCTSMTHRSRPLVAHCLACGLSFAPEKLGASTVEGFYAEVVDEEYLRHRSARERTFERVYEKIAPLLPRPGRMLEIGAYCGFFGREASKRGWAYTGVEPSRWAAEFARRSLGLDVRDGTFDHNIPALTGEFDAIVMWDVLEHLRDPRGCLAATRELLTDSGILCFSTLDMNTWFPRLMGSRWPWIMDMHLFYFTRDTLEQMLKASGLKLVRVESYTHFVSARYLLDKAAALTPAVFRWLIVPVKALCPAALIVPISFGDIRLFVCAKADPIPTGDGSDVEASSSPVEPMTGKAGFSVGPQ